MPKKQQNNKHERFFLKHQHSGQQRKKHTRKIVISLILLIVIATISIIGWYYYNSQAKPYSQAAIRVNHVTFNMRYYINMLGIYYGNVSSDTLSNYTDYGDHEIEQFAGYVEQQIVRNETIKQGSLGLGVQIERDVIKADLKKSGIPVTDEHIDILMAQELVEKQVPSTQPQVHVQAMLLENESVAQEAIARLQRGESFKQVANTLSKIPDYKIIDGDLGWVTAREADLVLGSTKFGDMISRADVNVLSDPLYDDTMTTPISDNQTETKGGYWVYNILEKDDNRGLTANQENMLVEDLLEKCSAELQKDPNYNVEILLTQEMRDFALNKVVLAQGEGSVIIGTVSLPDGEAGVSYSYQLEVYGNKQGNTWSITDGSLPQGLSMDSSTGLISGVPKFAGGSSLTIEVNSGLHYNRQDLIMRVYLPVSVSTNSLPDGQVGVYYSVMIEVLGDSNIYTWSIISGTLPDGLTLDQYTGYISGTPTIDGTYDFTIQVDDGLGKAIQILSISVR